MFNGKINNLFVNSTTYSPAFLPGPNPRDAIIDSGCSFHTLREDAPVDDKTATHHVKLVGTPTGDVMRSSSTAKLKHNLPPSS